MAATYNDEETTPKDRVRGLMGDVAAPARFSDGRIDTALKRLGETQPEEAGDGDEIREVRVAIGLLETITTATAGGIVTRKQGSVTYTVQDAGNTDFGVILSRLRLRLSDLMGGSPDVAVAPCCFPEIECYGH